MSERPTVSQAVTSFIVVFSNSPNVQAMAANLVEKLSQSPDWSAAEVAEVRRLIDERLQSATVSSGSC